jgi:signal transduction histidine kinase
MSARSIKNVSSFALKRLYSYIHSHLFQCGFLCISFYKTSLSSAVGGLLFGNSIYTSKTTTSLKTKKAMKSILKVLCLEDLVDDFELINYTLKKSGLSIISKRVDTREEYIEALKAYNPDIILSDHSLPQFNSTEALGLCQQTQLCIPFILVTGAVSDEFAVKCLKLGADDYVLKSNLHRLPSAIENALKHKETERARSNAMMELATQNGELLKINKELDSFVYSVSHNLRAPLMSVLGLVNLARQENNNETLLNYHNLMENSINKLDDTLKEILDYAKNSRQELQTTLINFNKIVNETIDKMKFVQGFELLDVNVLVNDRVPFYSDDYRISVIMNNLISNAIKYLDQNKTNSIFSIHIITNEKKALLTFLDNGIGIDEQLLPKIFNMFFRGTDKKEGSGLGLYIVKEAVEKLNGNITIESVIGKRTLLTIEIPNQYNTEFA